MAGTTGSKSTSRRKSTNRPNRAQMRAMEVRAAETAPGVTAAGAAALTTTGAVAVNRRSINRAVARPIGLTRDQEMAYVRKDLHRLLYIGSGLFVLMIVLLLILD